MNRRKFLGALMAVGAATVIPFARPPKWTLDDMQYGVDEIWRRHDTNIDTLYMNRADAEHLFALNGQPLIMRDKYTARFEEKYGDNFPISIPGWHIPEGTVRMLRYGNTGAHGHSPRPIRTWLYQPATRTFVGYEEKV